MPQQSCLELPATICVLRTTTAMLSAHIHTIESGCKRLARRIRSTWEARALRQVVVRYYDLNEILQHFDTDLRREQLFLLLAVGCSGLHPPQVREGYISRRAAAFDGENQIHLNFRGVGDWRLVPWGIIGGEHESRARQDAVRKRHVLGTLGLDPGLPEQHWVYLWDRIRKQSVSYGHLRRAIVALHISHRCSHHHSGPHSFSIIYPDLKTENLFLDSRGRTYITEHMESVKIGGKNIAKYRRDNHRHGRLIGDEVQKLKRVLAGKRHRKKEKERLAGTNDAPDQFWGVRMELGKL
ncbi:hypothetical protein B0H14DRAFT_2586766 [Mycena olivaceomarginata]|nr:hypothetical protein B0H14DRAFT_2586766 [Mycena olivaceomarginata]